MALVRCRKAIEKALERANIIEGQLEDARDLDADNEPAPNLTKEERQILHGMFKRPNLAMRSIGGIVTDAKLNPVAVEEGLNSLITKGLVEQGRNTAGKMLYYATLSGRRASGLGAGPVGSEQPNVSEA